MYPVLFQIGSFKVHTFGVVMIVAFLTALFVARKRAPRFGLEPNKLSDMAFITLIAGVLGARIAYLLLDPPRDWHEILSLQFAGLTSFGGIIGGAIAVIWWARKSRVALRPVLDVLGPPLLIGWAVGRVACLFNGCCFGGVCPETFPLGVRSPDNPYLHYPAQLYDTLMNLAAFGLVLLIERKARLRPGQMFALALGLWGVSRIIDEFSRAGTPDQVRQGLASSTYWAGLPFTEAQTAALAVVALAGILLWAYARKPLAPRPAPTPSPAHE